MPHTGSTSSGREAAPHPARDAEGLRAHRAGHSLQAQRSNGRYDHHARRFRLGADRRDIAEHLARARLRAEAGGEVSPSPRPPCNPSASSSRRWRGSRARWRCRCRARGAAGALLVAGIAPAIAASNPSTMAMAAASARRRLSGCRCGTPNSTMMASPISLSMEPPCRIAISQAEAKKRSSSATTRAGSASAAKRRETPDVREETGDGATHPGEERHVAAAQDMAHHLGVDVARKRGLDAGEVRTRCVRGRTELDRSSSHHAHPRLHRFAHPPRFTPRAR